MSSSAKSICLTDLRARILSQDIAPGEALDEQALSRRYGISRTPLREILQRLSGEGYVRITPGRGATATPLDLVVLRNFFETAPLVYATTARLAARNRTAAQLNDLSRCQAAFLAAGQAGDAGAQALHNHRFHAIIGHMAANPYLQPALERMLIDHTRLSQTFYRPTDAATARLVAQAGEHHDEMIRAIEAQNEDEIVTLTLRHWDLSRDRIADFVRPDPLPLEAAPDAV